MLLRVAFYLALAIAGGWLLWRFREPLRRGWEQLLADWRRFWERLFGRRRPAPTPVPDDSAPAVAEEPPRRPFADYANPFRSDGMPPDRLVVYSFEAMEAWATEQGEGRASDATPLEFAQRLLRVFPDLGRDTVRLAQAYSRQVYGAGRATAEELAAIRRVWDGMERMAGRLVAPS